MDWIGTTCWICYASDAGGVVVEESEVRKVLLRMRGLEHRIG